MKDHYAEVDANFKKFSKAWRAQLHNVEKDLAQEKKYGESYRRLVSLQAWRAFVLEQTISDDSLSFFLEAQNDALVSLTVASLGSWRLALKALRSCIENVLYCLYYKDHPVELHLWHTGKHKLSFSEMMSYFEKHPKFSELPDQLTGLDVLKKEYTTLSRAVHGSAKSFQMTGDIGDMLLWSSEKVKLGAWASREKAVLLSVNLSLLAMFHEKLQGAALSPLRKAISPTIPKSKHQSVKKYFGVTLFDSKS